ncbi:hypothetical protein SDC9_113989 [bioreactor metagenome]|uniref:Uncharacterized protein n=1 Tax=bioreactor metagenome TaxID=1076179 RepID=A0A645BV16_9ZZZZ
MKKDLTYNSEASIDSLNKKNNNFINESLSNYNSFNYYKYDSEINNCISTLKKIQDDIFKEYQVNDILSNSKIYEVITANSLGHILIPGHSGSRDARNSHGGEYEYKHFKESSSNHSWTFNDFSNTSIEKLKKAESIIFAHIDDINYPYPGRFDWYYSVPGDIMTNYLTNYTKSIQNSRKMINVSPSQIESRLNIKKIYTISNHGIYDKFLDSICNASSKLENLTGIKNLLTSNKFWELIVALKLNHQVNPEQGGREGAHDAYDIYGEPYEYKVSKSYSWSFQDISENVLNKYYNDKAIILAVVDKQQLKVESIYSASPEYVVPLLEKKLNDKKDRCKSKGTTIRRLQVSLSKSDLKRINAKKLY